MKLSLLIPLALLSVLAACADEDPRPQGHWQLSAEYVASTMTLSDAAVREAIADGQFIPKNAGSLPQDVVTRWRQMAARMQLRRTPAIYLDTGDTRPVPQAAARFTREGAPYVLVNASALALWSPDQLVAVLGHELVHLRERHVTPERMAEAYNQPGLSIAHELEADRVGAGPLGSCDPQALESALQIVIDRGRENMVGGVANPVNEASDLLAGDHPPWPERKAALDAMIAHPPPECAMKQRHPRP